MTTVRVGAQSALQALQDYVSGDFTHLVQMIVLTIDGQQVVYLGPVVHAPSVGIHAGDVQNVEFGEVIPARLAARLIGGEFTQEMGVQ